MLKQVHPNTGVSFKAMNIMNLFVNYLFKCVVAKASNYLELVHLVTALFSQFTGEKEPGGGLDISRGDGGPLVVAGHFGSIGINTLKQIIEKGVHDAHGLGGDTGVGVYLLQYLVDVDGIELISLGSVLFAVLGNNFSGLGSLGRDTVSRKTFSRKTLRTPQVFS